VRAAGRFERTDFITDIATAMSDSVAEVRAAAADAMAQAVTHGGMAAARIALVTQLERERDPMVRGTLAESLGRLPDSSSEELRASASIIAGLAVDSGSAGSSMAPAATVRGVARGLFFLTRNRASRGAITDSLKGVLWRLVSYGRGTPPVADWDDATEARMLAASIVVAEGDASDSTLDAILADPDPYVREKAFAGVQLVTDSGRARALLTRGLGDPAAIVRFRALGVYVRRRFYAPDCGVLVRTTHDADESVALAAVDAAVRCGSDPRVPPLLDSLAGRLAGPGPGDARWQMPAHALVSLASVDANRARRRIGAFAANGDFFVRSYAAMAAGQLNDTALLYRLARDAHPDVRTAAINGLEGLVGHQADSVYLASLDSNDGQLLRTACTALRGSHESRAFLMLETALDRVTAMRRETSRDARVALLDRMKEFGGAPVADAVRSYLADFDSTVATHAADDIQAWTGRRPRTTWTPLQRVATPDFAALAALEQTRVTIEMEDGGTLTLALFPFDAPTNVARFVRLAAHGYYNGLTFHRVAPFFVVQGGSPDANEYTGDSLFTRDELGLDNRRGSIGVSTRGRDTGDGQVYVNMVDNVALDHEYTVWAAVTSGMSVVDGMEEGARIRRVTVRAP